MDELPFLLDLGVQSILISPIFSTRGLWTKFLKGKERKEDIDRLKDVLGKFRFVMIDSGAHTLLQQFGFRVASTASITKMKLTPPSPDELETYFNSYLRFANAFKDVCDAFVELDIGIGVGEEKVQRWREKLVEVLGQEKVIPVVHRWHGDMPLKVEQWMKEGFTYIGIGDTPEGSVLSDIFKVTQLKVKLHGFAYVSLDHLFTFPFYSVDSASWKWHVIFGSIPQRHFYLSFKSSGDLKKNKAKFAQAVWNSLQLGPSFYSGKYLKTIRGKETQTLIKAHVKRYVTLERLLTEYWRKKGVIWDDET